MAGASEPRASEPRASEPRAAKPGPAPRRRWLTVGETIGVLALLVSAAGLWEAHRERTAARIAAETEAQRARSAPVRPLVLTSRAEAGGRRLTLLSPVPARVIQTQSIGFPARLGVAPVETIGNPRIEAGWFEDALRRAVRSDTAGDQRRAGRLPVLITTRYLDDGVPREDRAIYAIGFRWRARLLGGDVPDLEGITLVARGGDRLPAKLNAGWDRAHPAS